MAVRPLPVGQHHSDMVADLLKELSNHNERSEERKGALVELLKVTREDNLAVWDEHFKTFLLLLLETLGDKEVGVPAQPSLRPRGRRAGAIFLLGSVPSPPSARWPCAC